MKKLTQLLVVGLVLVGSPAFGSSLTFDTAFGPLSDPISTTVGLPSFNTALGTLTSVQLDLVNVNFTASVTIMQTSGSPNPGTYTATFSNNYNLSDTNSPVNTVTDSLSDTSSSTNISTGNSATLGVTSPNQTKNGTPFGGAALVFYEHAGPSTITLNLTSSAPGLTISNQGQGDSTTGLISSASGTAEVIYTYTPVPEPSQTVAWVLGFGVCLLVGRNFFRRQSAL